MSTAMNESKVQQELVQLITNGNNSDAGKDGSKITAKLGEANNKFNKALDGRRNTWTYDWILPLIESEPEAVRGIVDFRSHITMHKIRAKLHELQLKMVINYIAFVAFYSLFFLLELAFSQLGHFSIK